MKKGKILLLALLILSACIGCESTGNLCGEEFLTVFYTSTENETRWIGDAEATVAIKRELFETYFSENEFLVFIVSNDWDLLQLQVRMEKNICKPEEIILEKEASEDYSFSLVVVIQDEQTGEVKKRVPQSGSLSFDKHGKITNFSIEMFDAANFK